MMDARLILCSLRIRLHYATFTPRKIIDFALKGMEELRGTKEKINMNWERGERKTRKKKKVEHR